MNWDRFREPDLDPAWRGDDEHDERECARRHGDCACIPMPSTEPSPAARAIDEHRRRVEWSNPLAVWPRD